MADPDTATDASLLRAKGNEFYKKNEYLPAIDFYRRATKIAALNDPLPYSNLSAALFEIGDYSDSIHAAEEALLRGTDQDLPWKTRINLRIMNAQLHVYARSASKPPSPNVIPTSSGTATYLRVNDVYQDQTKEEAWSKIIQNISPIKPLLSGVPENGVWANDYAVSLYDSSLAEVSVLKPGHVAMAIEDPLSTHSIANKISLCFARAGDARNIYATWIEMSRDKSLLRGQKHVNMFVNDGRPHTIARNLVMFALLEDLLAVEEPEHRTLLLHTIYYTYCSQLMPPATETILKQKFAQIIEMLEGHTALLNWLKAPIRYRQSLVVVMRSWQRQNHIYSPKTIQKEVTNSYFDDVKHGRLPTLENLGSRSVSDELQVELSIYRRTMALFPSVEFAKKHEPDLATVMAHFDTLDSTQGREVLKLREHVAQNWKVNPTWYADDWEQYSSHVADIKPTIENIPNDFFFFLHPVERPKDATRFYDYMKNFFSHAAVALRRLKKSMTITVSVGEVISKLESARYLNNATEWSTTHGFDRISLSNLPDCGGLSMMSHLFAMPLLKKHDAALVSMWGCLCLGLRNAQNLDITSTALASKTDLSKALGVEHKGYLPEYLGLMPLGADKGLLWNNTWKSLQSSTRPIDQLLSKESLLTWLYGLFFKLALPSNHPRKRLDPNEPPMRVHSPLNLSTFFRLLAHLAETRYPGHTLSQVLVSIMKDEIVTSARPTTCQVLTAAEVTTWRTNVKQSLCSAPFFAEMSTMAAVFARVLPFAIITDNCVVPPLRSIRKCKVHFPHLPFEENCHYLALIFTSFGFKPPEGGWGTRTIRDVLLNQEYITKHKEDVIVITTWKYDALTKSGSFWMREDIARKVDPQYWMCEVYNTFTWKPLYEDRAWSTYLDMRIGESWI